MIHQWLLAINMLAIMKYDQHLMTGLTFILTTWNFHSITQGLKHDQPKLKKFHQNISKRARRYLPPLSRWIRVRRIHEVQIRWNGDYKYVDPTDIIKITAKYNKIRYSVLNKKVRVTRTDVTRKNSNLFRWKKERV